MYYKILMAFSFYFHHELTKDCYFSLLLATPIKISGVTSKYNLFALSLSFDTISVSRERHHHHSFLSNRFQIRQIYTWDMIPSICMFLLLCLLSYETSLIDLLIRGIKVALACYLEVYQSVLRHQCLLIQSRTLPEYEQICKFKILFVNVL